MKTKTLKLTAILLIFAGVFTACNEKEPPIEPFLNIDKTTITAPAEGGVFTILVSSNGGWTAVVQDAESHLWLTLTDTSDVNDGVITINIAENPLYAIRRSATIKISMGSLSEYVLISQEAIGGYVPFKVCYYYGELEMVLRESQPFPRGKALLFKDYVPDEFLEKLGATFILYSSERNTVNLMITRSYIGFSALGLICNFPDFAREWLINKNGIVVYIEGIWYVCRFSVWGPVTPFCYVLTRLVKK